MGCDDAVYRLERRTQTKVQAWLCHKARSTGLGTEISGGEAQKLALARALYKNSAVVILDEPTAALDPVAENEIYSRFNSFVQGKTAIYISHRLSSCVFCTRIAVFDKAHLVETGTHQELLNAGGKYSELWNAQAKYYVN